ncbi:MAG: glycerate kinase, partial [Mediterranea sp.]|nr:glycerate kinase [Mediterranea sp.]
MKKIVIASDSFKGSVSSMEVAASAERAVRQVFPQCQVVKLPVADGGEGLVNALMQAFGGRYVECMAPDPLMEGYVHVEYGFLPDTKTAVIEMATVCGLPLVPPEKRNPMRASTYGLGKVIHDALLRGCRNFLIGIGGSATNDAGTGMLQALGFRFLDREGQELGQGGSILEQIHTIDASKMKPWLRKARFTIACDVDNPLSGPDGAACIFARQKGADDAMIQALDRGLKNFA